MTTVPAPAVASERRTLRVPYVVEVSMASDNNFWTGFTENLSEGGVFLATPREVPLGTHVQFELRLPTSGPWQVRGEVRWVRAANAVAPGSAPGVGVRFVDLDPVLESEIAAFLGAGREAMFFDGEDQ